jgi:LytS/YehU family sensor histidine kinase
MTFVENAFKHVSKDSDKQNWISIKLKTGPEELLFSVANSVSSNKTNDVVSYGGIGLKNVRRRLDLIYPEQYELDIQSSTESFEVSLKLKLPEPAFSKAVQKTRDPDTEIIKQEEFILPLKSEI